VTGYSRSGLARIGLRCSYRRFAHTTIPSRKRRRCLHTAVARVIGASYDAAAISLALGRRTFRSADAGGCGGESFHYAQVVAQRVATSSCTTRAPEGRSVT